MLSSGSTGRRRLVLLRHGRTEWNRVGRAQGHADIELDEVGHAQAAAAATYLSTLHPAAIWSSDLARARETAAYVEKATGLYAKVDERLREYDVGEREGLTIPEFAERFPQEYDAWVDGSEMPEAPGAESAADVEVRTVPALREYLSSLDTAETGLVVTHGASMKVALTALLGWPTGLAVDLQAVDNCAWVTLDEFVYRGRLRLVGYNEKAPLDFASGGRVG